MDTIYEIEAILANVPFTVSPVFRKEDACRVAAALAKAGGDPRIFERTTTRRVIAEDLRTDLIRPMASLTHAETEELMRPCGEMAVVGDLDFTEARAGGYQP